MHYLIGNFVDAYCRTPRYVTAPSAVPFFVPATIANALLPLPKANMKTLTKPSSKTLKVMKSGKLLKTPQTTPSALMTSYSAAAQSNATTRSYSADIQHFKQHGGTIPATAIMVAEYVANFAGTLAIATLQHRLIAIHREHFDNGLPSPIMDH